MKQQKLSGYKPNYPRRAMKGLTLAAAALMTLGTTAGCQTLKSLGARLIPMEDPTGILETVPPEDVQLEGYIAPEDPPATPGAPLLDPTPEPQEVRTDGMISIEETPEPTQEPEEIMLSGDVAIVDLP